MAICPNCGQKTSGDYCQFCNYPIPRPGAARRQRALVVRRAREAEKKANEYLEEIESIYEKFKEEIKKAREAEAKARREAGIAAQEKERQEVEEAKRAKEAEKQAQKQAEIEAKEKAKQEEEERAREEAEKEAWEKAKRETEERARIEAEKEAREKAEREAEERAREEAQKELPAEEKEKVAAAVEETKVELYIRDMEPLFTLPMDNEKVKHLEGYLEDIESIYEELKTGKVSSEEAIQKLRDISARLSKGKLI